MGITMIEFLIVGLGGFIGCCLRFAISRIMPVGMQFPFSTLLSNVIAGFFVGFFTALGNCSDSITPRAKLFLTTGMMGGLSTFSTFSLETVNMFAQSRYTQAVLNILLNVLLSFAGVVLGMFTAKLIFKKQ
jgi:CrcB protein